MTATTGLRLGEGKMQTVPGATCPGGPKEQLYGHSFVEIIASRWI